MNALDKTHDACTGCRDNFPLPQPVDFLDTGVVQDYIERRTACGLCPTAQKPCLVQAQASPGVIILSPDQNTPAELALRITMRAKMLEIHAKKAVEYAFEIGQLLNEAKPQINHGEWEQWLAEHCHLAQRTARAYMRLAKAFPSLSEAERQRVADLPIREALKAISTDPTPPPPKEPMARRVNSLEDRERVKSVFVSARNQLTKAAKTIDHAMPIKGGEVAALRKKLEAVLAQLTELQKDDGEVAA